MPVFVRIAHRKGWEVEVVRAGEPPAVETFESREAALAKAESIAPDWIEVGDIVGLGTESQHHRWSTLRRSADGTYLASGLRWGGPD